MLRNKRKTTFCEQKVAKKLCLLWAVRVSTPLAQSHKSFCAAFFKKRPLSSTLMVALCQTERIGWVGPEYLEFVGEKLQLLQGQPQRPLLRVPLYLS